MAFDSGAKAQILKRLYAALKGRSSTLGALPQRLKPVMIEAGTAGINACSTPSNKNSQRVKPKVLRLLYTALKGRSSTVQSPTMGGR